MFREMKLRRYRAESIPFFTLGFIARRYGATMFRLEAGLLPVAFVFRVSVKISRDRSELSAATRSHSVGFYAMMNFAVRMIERIFFSPW